MRIIWLFPAGVLLLAAFVFIRCSETNRDVNICAGMPTKCLAALCPARYGSSTTDVTDMQDGTVRRAVSTPSGSSCAPFTQTYSTYFKKCLQGQVYRSAQNDCRGAGNAGNNWNAQTFPFCNTADNSCQKSPDEGSDASVQTSPAASSCASDTTAGKNWNLLAPRYGSSPPGLLTYNPDLPVGVGNQIWNRSSYNGFNASTLYINADGSYADSNQLKTSSLFVLCSTEYRP